VRPFIVFALPRSRTAWLSRFLSYREWNCGHDELRHMRSLDDVKAWFSQNYTGTVETNAAPWWRLVMKYRSDLHVAVVRRPVPEVVDSVMALDMQGVFSFDRRALAEQIMRLDAKLDQIERRVTNALSIRFDELADERTCVRLFEHCLQMPYDGAWWASLASINIQCSMPAMVRYARAYAPQMARLAAQAKQVILADMAGHPVVVPNGVTIAEERFDVFLRDGARLFAEHSCAVGESPDSFLQKNSPVMRAIEQRDDMQIVTARSNGRMFGYLMTILCPSLESTTIRSAIHTAFFASSEFPGLGLKLQRAALPPLRRRGVSEVFFRAGPRGSGPRTGVLYQRLGAAHDGEIYRLSLEEA